MVKLGCMMQFSGAFKSKSESATCGNQSKHIVLWADNIYSDAKLSSSRGMCIPSSTLSILRLDPCTIRISQRPLFSNTNQGCCINIRIRSSSSSSSSSSTYSSALPTISYSPSSSSSSLLALFSLRTLFPSLRIVSNKISTQDFAHSTHATWATSTLRAPVSICINEGVPINSYSGRYVSLFTRCTILYTVTFWYLPMCCCCCCSFSTSSSSMISSSV